MEEAKKGSMAAVIGLTIDEVSGLCALKGVEIANINAENQIVIAGEKDKVDEAMIAADERGGKSVLLDIDVPSHTSHMVFVGEKMSGFLKGIEINDPKILFLTDVTAKYVSKAEEIRDNLAKQVSMTVQWIYLVKAIIANGSRDFYEIGPGKVLSGLIRKTDRTVNVKSLDL